MKIDDIFNTDLFDRGPIRANTKRDKNPPPIMVKPRKDILNFI